MLYLLKDLSWLKPEGLRVAPEPAYQPYMFLGVPQLRRGAGFWLLLQYAKWAGGLLLWGSVQQGVIVRLMLEFDPIIDPLSPPGLVLQYKDILGWWHYRLYQEEFLRWIQQHPDWQVKPDYFGREPSPGMLLDL